MTFERVPCACPRSDGTMIPLLPGHPDDGTCLFCGSLGADIFMARLEAGDVELGPTDKDYKVYVRNSGGAPFQQTHGESYKVPAECGHEGHEDSKHRWVTREVSETKFYFDHLSEEQKKRFVELLNAKKLKIGIPGHFYRMPFFIER